MEAIRKAYNRNLSQHLIFYLQTDTDSRPEVEAILFNNVRMEIIEMLKSGVVVSIIFSYVLTVISMLKATSNYEFVKNHLKINAILELLYFDEKERKKVLSQLISFCIQSTSKLHESEQATKALEEFLEKISSN